MNHKGENSNFVVKKTGGRHLSQAAEVNTPTMGPAYITCLPIRCTQRDTEPLLGSVHDQNLIMRKGLDPNLNRETFYKVTGLQFSKASMS